MRLIDADELIKTINNEYVENMVSLKELINKQDEFCYHCTYSETGCSDCKENQAYLKGQDDGLYAERNRVLQIIHYVDLNCFDPTGEIHDKLDVVREKVISGNVIEDYQNV